MAFPSQLTMYPDPVKGMNAWTKTILVTALVIGHDTLSGWIVPSRSAPVVYWRIASQSVNQKQHVVTWMDVVLEGHVYARNAQDRLYNLAKINTEGAAAPHITLEDTSPLFVDSFSCKPHLNYLAQGQLQVNGRFGVMKSWYQSPDPEAPKLNDINIP